MICEKSYSERSLIVEGLLKHIFHFGKKHSKQERKVYEQAREWMMSDSAWVGMTLPELKKELKERLKKQ